MSALLKRLRGMFASEQAWRIYVVLQVAGLAGIVFLDATNRRWSILPTERSVWGAFWYRWDLFDGMHYTYYATNWYALALIFGPILLAKAFDWVSAGKVKPSPQAADVADQMKASLVECTEQIRVKWIGFNDTLKFKDGVPLAGVIEMFAIPVSQFVENNYPLLLAGGGKMFWMMLFTAILESGTHPKNEVNAAIAVLEKKFAS